MLMSFLMSRSLATWNLKLELTTKFWDCTLISITLV